MGTWKPRASMKCLWSLTVTSQPKVCMMPTSARDQRKLAMTPAMLTSFPQIRSLLAPAIPPGQLPMLVGSRQRLEYDPTRQTPWAPSCIREHGSHHVI
eukprot:6218060-Amphidinium_carterae.1